MKSKRAQITREMVVKANNAMVRSAGGQFVVARTGAAKSAVQSGKTRLSSTEINKAYAEARKQLEAA